jgi:Uma2 family endonuclease
VATVTGARSRTNLSADDLINLPTGKGKRYELIEGELVTLTPAKGLHGFTTINVTDVLLVYNKQQKFGIILAAETGFFTRGDKRTVRAPDVAMISYKRLPAKAAKKVLSDYVSIPPDLVVEVVSPNDRAGEIEQKVKEWLDFGVGVVWVVYPEARRVHVFTGGHSQILNEDDTINGGEALSGFESPVSAFFRD